MDKILLTPVDRMVEIISTSDNINLTDLTKQMHFPREMIERWLIILEEYKILTVHYKGFEGFVKLIKQTNKNSLHEIDVEKIKEEFISKAEGKNLALSDIKVIWPKFLKKYENEIKILFEKKAKEKGIENKKIKIGWTKYLVELENF